jgi:murein DD-endopeptidase MepM/ murein hydrolase activator NlpD
VRARRLHLCMSLAVVLLGALRAQVAEAGELRRAKADSPWGANERVNDADTAYRNMAFVAVDPEGNAYAVWRDEREGNADIYFRYRSAGGSWGEDAKVNDDTGTAAQYNPSIAVDASGNAYAVWGDNRNGNWDIYFSYRPRGGSWGTNVRVNSDTGTATQYNSSIAVDSSGNGYVVWDDYRDGNDDVYFRYRSAAGSWGADFRVNDDSGTAYQFIPSIAVDQSGNAFVVWTDSRNGDEDIYFAYRSALGSWEPNTRVNDVTVGDQCHQDIAVDHSGNAYAVWQDTRNGSYDIYFSYRPAGASWGTSVRVNDEEGSGTPRTPTTIGVDPSGNAHAAWDDTRGESAAVYSSYRPSDGSWAKNVRVPDPDKTGAAAQVAVDSSGRSYTVYTRCLDMHDCNIYFSRNPTLQLPFDPDETDKAKVGEDCRGTENGLGECQSAYLDHHYPTFASNGDGVFRPFWGAEPTGTIGLDDCHPSTQCYDGHEGHDYRLVAGTPVRAAAAGTAHCEYAGSPGYGYTVLVDHHNGYSTRYGHLNKCEDLFAGGDVWVSAGQEIGRVGSSGTQRPHLHFGVYRNGQVVDPWGWDRRNCADPWEQTDPSSRRSACLWGFGCEWEGYLTASAGGGTATADGSIAASAPPGAVSEPSFLRLTLTPDPVAQPSGVPAGYSFDLSAQDIYGNAVDAFLQPLTIVVSYGENMLEYILENTLTLYYWDDGTSSWQGLVTALDLENNTATASTDHLSLFSLLGEPQNPAPTIVEVTPTSGCNALETNIAVHGTGFQPTPSVRLGDSALAVTFVGPGAVTSVVPPGFEPGTYDLRVVNPDAQEALLESAFVVDECSLLCVPLALKSY